ncbi:MAG: hypothetical protein Q9162_001592 [Coniocarpon cinnabarinum]
MAADPSTPAHRRVFTLPAKLRRSPSPATSPLNTPDRSAESAPVETLFTHSKARIVQFPAPQAGPAHEEGSLPWSKANERVTAAGALQLYKVRGQHVAFLSSGTTLLSLMPRSQCWCVDGESKFALRLKGAIYRIELPYETDQDRACVEDFKIALGMVLMYERTACPFTRSFKKEYNQEEAASPMLVGKLRRSNTKAKRWEFDEGWRPEGEEKPTPPERKSFEFKRRRRRSSPSSGDTSDENGQLSGANSRETSSTRPTSTAAAESEPYVVNQVKKLENARIVSGPPALAALGEDPFLDDHMDHGHSLQQDIAPASQYVPVADMKGSSLNQRDDDGTHAGKSTVNDANHPPPMDPHGGSPAKSTSSQEALSDTVYVEGEERDEKIGGRANDKQQRSPPKLTIKASKDDLQHPPTQMSSQSNSGRTPHTATFYISSPAIASLSDSAYVNDPAASTYGLSSEPERAPADTKHVQIEGLPALYEGESGSSREQQDQTPSATTTVSTCTSHAVKPRASQMLRDFRSHRPSTPSSHSTATARGLNLDLAKAHYLRNDPLPKLPYGSNNQSVAGKALTLLMGPPSGLVSAMMQIASRLSGAAASFDLSSWIQADSGFNGEGVFYERRSGRCIPGAWDDILHEDEEARQSGCIQREAVVPQCTDEKVGFSDAMVCQDVD